MAGRSLTSTLLPALIGAAFVVLTVAEERRPLRARHEPKGRRLARNLAVAATSAAAIRVFEQPAALAAVRFAQRHRFGIVRRLPLPAAARDALAVVLMDYSLYGWHVLTHRVPALWRFHQVHHADLELDASTALRFHAGEMILSAPWRALQVLLIGTSARALHAWQRLTLLSILFHHSNLRLPRRLERALAALVMTPRLHGIHHSTREAEVHSNWSSGLSLWDRLHGTLRTDVPQARIEIGLPERRAAADVQLGRMLALPLRAQEP
jgi:sterol desaturase/sphingolipid hydroxylase (fatty acid hydroxylase superfamily)